MHKFERVGMYVLERRFYSKVEEIQDWVIGRLRRPRFLFKLKSHLKPI
jgi:hypothetical protein